MTQFDELIRTITQDTQDGLAAIGVRAKAASALGAMGDEAAVPVLIDALEDENYLCVSAALALAKIGDPRAVAPLVAVLSDSNKFWVARGAAAVALGNMGKSAESAVSALSAALKYRKIWARESWDERAREAVEDALNRIQNPGAKSMLTNRGYRFEMWGIY